MHSVFNYSTIRLKTYILLLLLFPLFAHAQTIRTVVGNGKWSAAAGDSGPATEARLNQPIAIAVDDSGDIYIVDVGVDNIRKVDDHGIITTIAGKQQGDGEEAEDVPYGTITDGTPAIENRVWKPQGIVTDHSGNIYFPERENATIRKIGADGIITTIAGIPGKWGYGFYGDSVKATANMLNAPNGITMDNAGNIYFTEERNNMVREISADGDISVIAGTGYKGYSGDGGPATRAQLNDPWGIAVDSSGNIYVADSKNNVIRKINTAGIITTFAGTGENDYSGDGGSALKARLDQPMGVAADMCGNIYIADSRNDAIRRVDENGIITTFAGNGRRQYHGDDGVISSIAYSRDRGTWPEGVLATAAQLFLPVDVKVDHAGNVYIADDHNHTVEKVTVHRCKNDIPKEKIPKREIPKEDTMQIAGIQKADTPEQAPVNDQFSLSADPDKGILTISISAGAYTSFTITDMKNKVLIQQPITATATDVDISALQPAHYYINLKKGDKIRSAMFVKDK